MLTEAQKQNAATAAREAVLCEHATSFPAEVSLAQWAVESAWGSHQPGGNCFGIKQYAGCPGRQLLPTQEWFTPTEARAFLAGGDGRTAQRREPPQSHNGRDLYDVRDWFAAFDHLSQCFAKHAELITTAREYSRAWTQYLLDHDLTALVRGIAPDYATSPTYADTLLAVIRMPGVQAALAAARKQ